MRAFTVLFLLPSLASAAEVLDQVHDNSVGGGLEVTGNQSVGQIIEAGVVGTVTRTDVHDLRHHRCTPTVPLTMELFATNGTALSGSPLATQDFQPAELSNSFSTVTFDVSSASLDVEVGDTYALRLRNTAPGGGCTYAWGGGGSTYHQPGLINGAANPYWTMEFSSYIDEAASAVCGDAVCEFGSETAGSCPADCAEQCDGIDQDGNALVDEGNVCRCAMGTGGNGVDYAICLEQVDWHTADAACDALGMDLITLESRLEDRSMQRRLGRIWPYRGWWMGLNDEASEGTHVWESGVPFSYSNWAVGEPGGAGEDCAGFYPYTGTWYDGDCGRQLGFVCEAP
jgi:hypothetical protein